jgi:membrane protease YdiL (CAAX protease family)
MKKFRRHSLRGSYNLFAGYSHCLPGTGGMFLLLVLFLLGSLIGSLTTELLGMLISKDFVLAYGTIISYPIMFIPPMLYASVNSRRNDMFETGYALDSNNFGKLGGFRLALIASAATLAAAFVVEPLTALLPPMPKWLEDIMNQLLDGSPLWATLLSVSVFAPLFEEWLCRGIVLRGLLRKMSPAAAICISAAFFAILHMNPWQAIPAFCLGILFGYVYYRTGSLKLTMLMHCVNNTLAALISQIPAFKDAETFMEIMNPWAYAGAYVAFILILASGLVIFRAIPLKEGNLGGCDKVESL